MDVDGICLLARKVHQTRFCSCMMLCTYKHVCREIFINNFKKPQRNENTKLVQYIYKFILKYEKLWGQFKTIFGHSAL